MLDPQQSDEERDVVGAIRGLFDDEERAVEEFFSPVVPDRGIRARKKTAEKPTHYKVISISMYTNDIDRLSILVDELKRRGHTRANKSMVIREALRQLDLSKVPSQR